MVVLRRRWVQCNANNIADVGPTTLESADMAKITVALTGMVLWTGAADCRGGIWQSRSCPPQNMYPRGYADNWSFLSPLPARHQGFVSP